MSGGPILGTGGVPKILDSVWSGAEGSWTSTCRTNAKIGRPGTFLAGCIDLCRGVTLVSEDKEYHKSLDVIVCNNASWDRQEMLISRVVSVGVGVAVVKEN
eukprot:9885320-Ditylum_brightwellii.AAC.1